MPPDITLCPHRQYDTTIAPRRCFSKSSDPVDPGQMQYPGNRYPAVMTAMKMADVLVEPITRGDIRPLFPLMRAVDPELKLSAWLTYSRQLTRAKAGARAGIMVARRRGHSLPCGAVHYRLERNLRFGQLLIAEHFIALDLLYPHAVLAALFAALDGYATECGCSAMRSILHDGKADLLDRLRVAGHHRDGMTLTKNFLRH